MGDDTRGGVSTQATASDGRTRGSGAISSSVVASISSDICTQSAVRRADDIECDCDTTLEGSGVETSVKVSLSVSPWVMSLSWTASQPGKKKAVN